MKNIVNSFKINTLSSRKGLGVGLLFLLLTLGVGQMWGATQRYIYVGISSNYQTYKDGSNYGFNFWGGTSGGVKSGTYLTTYTWDKRTYYMYRVQVYDDNNKTQFKGNNSWYDPADGFSVTLNGTTNNAVFFSHSSDGWQGQFQQNYQVTSTASLSASSTSITTAQTSTLTPSLSSNSTYNEIKSTTYSVSTNPGSAGSVTSAGVFSATAAGTYTVTATVTYNAKGFSGITKTATATKSITVSAAAETTHSVTITYKCGSTTVSTGTSQTIGEVTAASVTAPTVAGYTFSNWTLGTGISNQSANTSANPISVKTKSSGTHTMQANYAEDLSSPWHLLGAPTPFGGWSSSSSNMLQKASGSSTGSVASITINVSALPSAEEYTFKLYNATTDKWRTNGGYWVTRANNNPTLSTEGGTNNELIFKPDVIGNYTFSLDYSSANPVLTVTFPTKYTVTYSVAPSGAANAITTSPSVTSGGYVAAGTSITFTHAAAKTGYSWYRWENGSGSSLGTGSTYTTTINANTTVVAKYTENTYNVTATASAGGSATPTSATSMGQITGGNITATPNTGYNFVNWTITSGSGYFGTSGTATTSTTANTKFRPTAAATIQANFTAKTYSITLDCEGATTGSTSVTMTYNSSSHTAITAPTKTGYTFGGWYSGDNGTGSQVMNASGVLQANVSGYTGAGGIWTKDATCTLYAKWTPKQCTVNFDFDESDEGYGSRTGATTSVTATYGANMTTVTPPTAKNGYAFMGYWDGADGSGTQYYKADGTSKRTWNKNTESATTLYAFYKKAEITGITLDAAIWAPVAAGDATTYITADPTIAPTPEGTTSICWELLYDNDNPVPGEHPAITVSGYKVKFAINGLATGNYKIRATLHTGSGTCGSGTTLSTLSKTFTIATDFDVTVKYMCGTEEIQPSTTVTGKATEWTSVSAPDIFGYTFTTWDLGDGGITKHGSDALTKQENFRFKATYNGTLTAVYRKRGIIYFKKPSDWTGTKVYYYNLGSSDKWHTTEGDWKKRGIYTKDISWGAHEMTRITGTSIYYYDYEAENNAAANPGDYIAFADASQDGYEPIYNCKASYPIQYTKGFNTGTPMFVCTNYSNSDIWNDVKYYNHGYWTKYERGSGYTLKIYNKKESGRQEIKSVPFVTDGTNNFEIPFKATVDLDAATTYGFKIVRDDNLYFKNDNDGTMTYSSHDGWPFLYDGSDGSACGITTTAAGSYVFTLSYFNTGNNADHELRVSVTYPAAVNDFQVYYKDASKPAHPSRMIKARAGGVDTISFFVHKTNTPMLKARKVTNASTMTWGALNIKGAASMSLSVDSSAVYNFKVTQGSAGVISSIVNIGAYTGEYYIRCGALNSKWDNYTIDGDHKMTYSSFSESDANAFGEKFSHYKAKWCPRGTNVKFAIANDYSPCISDTLIQDVGNPYNNIYLDDAWGRPDGELKADGYDGSGNITTSETGDRYSANIRFMWNRKTNKISRAYVASSTNPERLFLVLRGNYAIKGTDNENIEDEGTGIPSVILQDDQNWIYEEILYIKPNTRFKLYACYAQVTASPNGAQYFRGSYNSNAFSGDDGVDSENSVVLISGNGEYQKARVLYDFKTNRLICAWLPSETAVSSTLNINADVMIIREHQEAAQYLSFADADSKLTGVKTVYGVMKFNRWVLNNRQQTGTHLPLDVGDQKSIFERSLYFISFPFDVRLGDIFGFGQYGVHWILEYYDGLTRAKNGFWIDSPPNWKYVMPSEATSFVLKANEGYILALDLDQMGYNNTDFWPNDIQTVELFFPSTAELETLKQTTCTIPALSSDYKCTINRTGEDGDRRVKDSYWRCIGTPSLNLYNTAVKDGSGHTIAWKTDYTWHEDEREFPFIYMWNKADNTLTPQSTSTFRFLPMHSYLVQNGGQIIWTNASAKPSSIVSRRENDYQQIDYNWRLELAKDSQMVDQAYIRMSNLEQVTDTFDFGQDLSKEFNATRSNIYSFIGYEKAAANSMPLKTEQTTIVAIGLNIITAGEYTLGMPDGTDGVGVTLVDSETGTRTNLSAGMTYTVTLAAGDYTSRFYLEISPVKETPTGLEQLPTTNDQSPIKKLLIDGVLYIIRDGKIFDARGVMVK